MWRGIKVVLGWEYRNIVFIKDIISFFRLSCLLTRKLGKETALRDRPAGRSLKYPPGERAFAHKKVQRLHTHDTYRNDPPTERRVLFFVVVPTS